MDCKSKKILTALFAVYLGLLFLVIEPTHAHDDHVNHADCVLCIFSSLPASVESIFSVIPFAILLLVVAIPVPAFSSRTLRFNFLTRAPPAL
jgi:hypothetical protein